MLYYRLRLKLLSITFTLAINHIRDCIHTHIYIYVHIRDCIHTHIYIYVHNPNPNYGLLLGLGLGLGLGLVIRLNFSDLIFFTIESCKKERAKIKEIYAKNNRKNVMDNL